MHLAAAALNRTELSLQRRRDGTLDSRVEPKEGGDGKEKPSKREWPAASIALQRVSTKIASFLSSTMTDMEHSHHKHTT